MYSQWQLRNRVAPEEALPEPYRRIDKSSRGNLNG